MNTRKLWGIAMLLAAWFFLGGVPSVPDARSSDEIKSVTPLNEQNLDIILDNRGKFTASDLTKMLGPPSSAEIHAAFPGLLKMHWNDVTRIEMKCRDGVVESVTGTFSPRLPSRIINYTVFTELRTGVKADDVLREYFVGWAPEVVKDADEGTVTLVFEQYNRFCIVLRDGKVSTAQRLWHTDEHLNTPVE